MKRKGLPPRHETMTFILDILEMAWWVLQESAVYMLFGFLVAGILRALLTPAQVARHLGTSRTRSVIIAALAGIPIPL